MLQPYPSLPVLLATVALAETRSLAAYTLTLTYSRFATHTPWGSVGDEGAGDPAPCLIS